MGKMKELGMEERQQSEINGEPKTCVRCGWKTWSMKSRACTYPGGIHKFGPVLGGGDTEPKRDVLERGRAILDDTTEGGISPTGRVREFVADAIAEIKRLGRAHEVVVAAYNLAHLEVETSQARLHTEAKPVLW